jgi:hypothetical protein
LNVGRYQINLDALLARIVYRWRLRVTALALLLVAMAGITTGIIPPLWKGRAALAVLAAPGATVQLDAQPWPRAVYAGEHTLLASLPDGRSSWATFTLRASEALTLTLPAGLSAPIERSLPPAAPGTHIERVWWADNAWRVSSVQDPPVTPSDSRAQMASETATALPGQTVAVSAQGMERLPTLDAYAGLADQVHVNGRMLEAVYRANPERGFSNLSTGSIELRGWGAVQTIPISAPLTLLRFAPDGATLLVAEQVPSGGEQVYLIAQNRTRVPLVALPGQIARLSWRPDGSAVVIHSLQGERLTLTLVRLAPTVSAAAIAEFPAASYAGSIVPLTWDADGLLWVAPDQNSAPALWRAPLTSLIPERKGALDARALTCLPDGTLRILTIQDGAVVVGRVQGDIIVGEATVSRVPAAPDLMGIWQGQQLLLQGGGQVWLLDLAEGST